MSGKPKKRSRARLPSEEPVGGRGLCASSSRNLGAAPAQPARTSSPSANSPLGHGIAIDGPPISPGAPVGESESSERGSESPILGPVGEDSTTDEETENAGGGEDHRPTAHDFPPVAQSVSIADSAVEGRPISPGIPVGEYATDSSSDSLGVGPVGESDSSDFAEEVRRGAGESGVGLPVPDATVPPLLEPFSPTAAPVGEASDSGVGSSLPAVAPPGDHNISSAADAAGPEVIRLLPRSLLAAQVRFARLHTGGSPTPIPNPSFSGSDGNGDADAAGVDLFSIRTTEERELEQCREALAWLEEEQNSISNAAQFLTESPEPRISGRSEYWEAYNRMLAAAGFRRRHLWNELTETTDCDLPSSSK
ncbi:hypothetical protein C8Q76DRAFT_697491 [Earliella scabrosa]|nr:hypothetical protein C8Q76DRAFT_697491 [Earliella scabrosa]